MSNRPPYLQLVHSTPVSLPEVGLDGCSDSKATTFSPMAANGIALGLFIVYLPFLAFSVFGFTGILVLLCLFN